MNGITYQMLWFKLIHVYKSGPIDHVDGLVQERHNSIANALELRLCCTNPLM